MITWLASFPRSGNSFFRKVCSEVFGFQVYSIYPEKLAYLDSDSLKQAIADDQTRVVKTHELPSDNFPSIYLVRDGRDALVSLTWFTLTSLSDPYRKIPAEVFQGALEKVILSKSFGGWSENVFSWTKRSSRGVIVKFEDLIVETEKVIPKALDEIGFDYVKQDKGIPTFEQLHNKNPHLFRKGKIGSWQDHMTPDLHDLFWEVHGKAMLMLGYTW